jgi:hypothetical protein
MPCGVAKDKESRASRSSRGGEEGVLELVGIEGRGPGDSNSSEVEAGAACIGWR